jgi:hypothetical protein
MVDGGVIAAYLAAGVARGGRRLLDRVVDGTLDRLTDSVARRLGPRPAADLAKNPYDGTTLAEVTRAIDAVARYDARFARELAGLRRQLDKHGGWRLVNQVRGRINIQAFGGGNADGRDHNESHHHYVTANDYDSGDELVAGRGPGQVLAWVGILVALGGFLGWMYVIFTGFGGGLTGPLGLELVDGVPLAPAAFGAFLAGGLMYGIGVSFSKAARRREQGDLRSADGRRRR